MEPSKKSPAMEKFIKDITGVDRIATIRANICAHCRNSIGPFRDALSEKEYTISGLCQDCQDKVFGK